MSQRSIEVRVGILILVALALLGGFIVVMGGLSFKPTYDVFIDFENPGSLQAGAPIRLAGMKIGKVVEIQFRGGEPPPQGAQAVPPIRVVARIERQYQDAIRSNARWYVTTQGVLGEQFLAVEPGSREQRALQQGDVVHGVSPPRLDLLLSESYELLHKAYQGITANEQQIKETFDGLHATLRGTGRFFENNGGKLDTIVENAETFTEEANATLVDARERYVTGPQVARIMNNVERTTARLDQDLPPLLTDGRALLAEGRGVVTDTKRITGALSSTAQLDRYEQITRDVGVTTSRVKSIAGDSQQLVSHIRQGKGTVGALMMDEAIYDDIQEMLRDLKHNPWKFFWRE